MKTIYLFSYLLTAVILIGVVLLVLGTLPSRNEVAGDEIIVHYILGNTTRIDISDARMKPVPTEAKKDLIRTFGTSLGEKNSGHFKNVKTGAKFMFYTTGKGELICLVTDSKCYIVDLPKEAAIELVERKINESGITIPKKIDKLMKKR